MTQIIFFHLYFFRNVSDSLFDTFFLNSFHDLVKFIKSHQLFVGHAYHLIIIFLDLKFIKSHQLFVGHAYLFCFH